MDCSGEAAAAAAAAAMPLTTLMGAEGDKWPVPDRVWEVFQMKGIRTSFLTIGASASPALELELAESLGCPIHYVPLTETEAAGWSEVVAVLKERKREGANATTPFSVGAEAKWVLPKNLRAQSALPWWSAGKLDMGNVSISTVPFENQIRSISEGLKLKDSIVRVDILKIDTLQSAPGLEKGVLGALLSSGFRPSCILVRWAERPDVSLTSCTAAGHLQSCGYRLMAKEGDKFLYHFTDDDMYQICSWEDTSVRNPMFHEIVSTARVTFSSSPEEGATQAPE